MVKASGVIGYHDRRQPCFLAKLLANLASEKGGARRGATKEFDVLTEK